jgi:cytidylate kinase
VARALGFRHLDSGALYRALTWALLDRGYEPSGWGDLDEQDLAALDVSLEPGETGFHVRAGDRRLDEELRTTRVTDHVSQLARLRPVRSVLLRLQREAGSHGRLVADGRDMGTVVFPHADLKVYLVADLAERARRRILERDPDHDPTAEEIQAEARLLATRDRRDSEREHSPLRKPDDAWELDTTGLTFEAQVEAVVRRARLLTGS